MKKSKLYRSQCGFTLIEMLAVVAIIATIAVALIAGYKNVIPYVSGTTSEVMVGKLNNAANEWMMLKIQAGYPDTRLENLGTTLQDAIANLKESVQINNIDVSVGLPKNLSPEKLAKLGIQYEKGEFSKKSEK